MRTAPSLEHCVQKWIPVLRKNNATTQDLKALSAKVGTGFAQNNATTQDLKALSAKVGTGFAQNNATTQDLRAFLRFRLKAKRSRSTFR
jgi:deoxyribose-phosphate aldolase